MVCITRHFNCHFPGKSGLAGCPLYSQALVILGSTHFVPTEYFRLYLTHLH